MDLLGIHHAAAEAFGLGPVKEDESNRLDVQCWVRHGLWMGLVYSLVWLKPTPLIYRYSDGHRGLMLHRVQLRIDHKPNKVKLKTLGDKVSLLSFVFILDFWGSYPQQHRKDKRCARFLSWFCSDISLKCPPMFFLLPTGLRSVSAWLELMPKEFQLHLQLEFISCDISAVCQNIVLTMQDIFTLREN